MEYDGAKCYDFAHTILQKYVMDLTSKMYKRYRENFCMKLLTKGAHIGKHKPGGTRQGGQPNQDEPGGIRQGGQPNQDKPGGTRQGDQPNQDEPGGTRQGGQPNQDKFVPPSVRPSVRL